MPSPKTTVSDGTTYHFDDMTEGFAFPSQASVSDFFLPSSTVSASDSMSMLPIFTDQMHIHEDQEDGTLDGTEEDEEDGNEEDDDDEEEEENYSDDDEEEVEL